MANVLDIDMTLHRNPYHDIEYLFVKRWSPRAMSGEKLSNEQLLSLFEAARWAPSAFNEQPWHFLYAVRDTPNWKMFFDLLVEGNQAWCDKAAALIVLTTSKTFSRNGNPNSVCVFDTGAAWQNLALQGASMNLVVHGMAGFDADKARKDLGIPDSHDICAMIAVGKPGDPAALSEQMREMEKPSSRKPVTEIATEGAFKG